MLTSLTSSSDNSPTRLPIRQKGSVSIPLLPTLDLPPLPPITNPAIRRMSLTHSSAHPGEKSRKRDLITNEAEAVLDYEKLEHVGDGLLTAAVITLLHDKYPAFGAGPATYLRGHMVSNRSLAQIAEQYKIPEMVIAEQHSKYMLQAGEKVKGSLFEAYVAGVYYSFLHPRDEEPETPSDEVDEGPSAGDLERAGGNFSKTVGNEDDPFIVKSSTGQADRSRPNETPCSTETETTNSDLNKDSLLLKVDNKQTPPPAPEPSTPTKPKPPAPSPDSDPSEDAQTPPARTHGQAFDHICSWLWPLFHPIAEFLKSHLGTQSEPGLGAGTLEIKPNQLALALVPEDWKVEDSLAAGAIGALNQFLGRTYGCGYLPTWLTKRKGEQVWKMTCTVRTPEGKEIRSEAKRLTKRGAMKVAAYHVWQELKAWEEGQAANRAEESDSESEEGALLPISKKAVRAGLGLDGTGKSEVATEAELESEVEARKVEP